MAVYELSLTNEGEHPITVEPQVEGIDASWVVLARRVILEPGARRTVRAIVVPPRGQTTRAGEYSLALLLTAQRYPGWVCRREAILTVQPFYEVTLSLHSIEEGATPIFALERQVLAEVTNRGNAPVGLVLEGKYAEESCRVTFGGSDDATLERKQLELALLPGEEVRVLVTITLHQPSWERIGRRVREFTVTATTTEDPPLQHDVRGQLVYPSPLESRIVVMSGFVTVILLCGLLLWTLATPSPAPMRASTMWMGTNNTFPGLAVIENAEPLVAGIADPNPRRTEQVSQNTLLAESAPIIAVGVATEVPVPVDEIQVLAEQIIVTPSPPPRDEQPAPQETPQATTVAEVSVAHGITEEVPAADVAMQGESYEELLGEVALHHGLDWHLLASMVYQESRFNPTALGRDNDMGLMQILPSTWELVAPQVNVYDPFDPYSNLMAGAYYLTSLQQRFAQLGYPEIYWALAAYNWGPVNLTNLLKEGGGWEQVPVVVQRYVWNILSEAVSPSAEWWETDVKQIVEYNTS
ncbi:MAG: transglycosylase SLT domain-containing protein [Chloroflexota bacterium]|nr:transglycosylase SLT domain-containing protein [Chloroflexota bacterium]